ncbi:esterase [Taibaiella sp. KBW10]|uniref:alpha/beta hydrolase n=1 Tax=Taibaiella sp. KBW10 TaxID=2153357 RepID=UPI000F5AF53B|nr:alpha/beta hydrolase-fold protein [Taibaiella sp. KBW10]RQO30734.1 esterase [Taibaiella sp. KBW10]
MKRLMLLGLLTITFFLTYGQKNKSIKSSPLVLGRIDKLYSKALKETRTLSIYLPEGYNAKDTVHYPVIYVLDGGVEEDFIHITGIVRYNTQAWIARFPKSIVVGIENTNRKRDFTFSVPDLDFVAKMGFKKEQFPAYGGSAHYIAFLEQELQPYITQKYKGTRSRTVIGESLAGLLATEILLKHRHLFDHYIIIAPSLWWGSESLLKPVSTSAVLAPKPVSVYIGACAKEEEETMYQDALTLSNMLKEQQNLNVYFDYLPEEIHATIIHQATYNAFKLFYPKTIYQK